MKALILQQANYNVWANKRIADLLLKNPSLLDIEVKSSFPSLRKTVHHIWDAELIWYSRMQGKNLPWPPTEHLFKNPAIDKFVETSQEFARFVENVDDHFLKSATSYRNSKGISHENPN